MSYVTSAKQHELKESVCCQLGLAMYCNPTTLTLSLCELKLLLQQLTQTSLVKVYRTVNQHDWTSNSASSWKKDQLILLLLRYYEFGTVHLDLIETGRAMSRSPQ